MSEISVQAKVEELGYNFDALTAAQIEMFQVAVGNIFQAAYAEWQRLAQHRTKTSREIYLNGLRQSESYKVRRTSSSSIVYEMQLVGQMANDFEFGKPAYDMKTVRPGWLGGGKARTAKDGHKYIFIPFRHSTSSDSRVGYTGKAKAADLKTELKTVVRQYGLNRMIYTASGSVATGAVRRLPKAAVTHPYLQGLTRVQQATRPATTTSRGSGQGRLMTWRIMSENSPADSWWQPELKALNLLPEVEAYLNNQLTTVAERIMDE